MQRTLSRSDSAPPLASAFKPFYRHWSAGFRSPSDTAFALMVSAVWIVFYNVRFWSDTLHAMWHGNVRSAAFIGSLLVFVWCLQALLLLLLPSRRVMVGAASLCFLIAAASWYFSLKYGVVMNKDTLRNVFETDAAESHTLMSVDFIEHLIVFGLVPALLVWKVRLPDMHWSKRWRQHAVAILALLGACAFALLSTSASYAVRSTPGAAMP